MKKISIIIVVVGLLFVIPIFSTICISAETFKPVTLKFASPFPENSYPSKYHKWWAEEVEKRTGGKVKVQVFWMESLVKFKDMLPGIKAGYADIGIILGGYHPSNFPLDMLLENVYSPKTDYVAVLQAVQESLENEPNLKAELERENIIFLGIYFSGQTQLITKKCLNSIKDLKGMVVRSAGAGRAELYKHLGANPVFMPLNDMYEALDRGTVSALADINPMSILNFKLYEIIKCVHVINSGIPAAPGISMNLEVFRKLPKDIQEVLIKLRKDYTLHYAQGFMDFDSTAYSDLEKKYGIKLKYPSDEDQKLLLEAYQNAQESFIKKQEGAGHTAARKVVDYYYKALKKYEDERAKKK